METVDSGRQLALQALSGRSAPRIPALLFTWEFDYIWKIAGLSPWQLACGGSGTWHAAHLSLLERHRPDLLMYSGAGTGPEEPVLLSEDAERWVVRDNNSGCVYGMTKNSYSLYTLDTGTKTCDPVGDIEICEDADRLVPVFTGWGKTYLDGLTKLIRQVGDRALVLPHHSPAYICACYAFGFEAAMTAMLEQPDLFTYVCDRYGAGDRLRMRELADAGAQAVFLADGWASCDIISPAMFERFALPYQESITRAASECSLRVILWNEGDIQPILAQEASLGIDAFAFEQPRKGVEITVGEVRNAFGGRRCLLGNLDSELLLLRNDPEEIERCVRDQIRQSGADNPFIFSTGSPIPSNAPPEAVDAMIRACRAAKV